MAPFQTSNKGVVRLSHSLDGVHYINAGEFVYYDGEQLAKTYFHSADTEGVWDLQNSIFPCIDMKELLSISFTPTCEDEDGVITEARFPISYEYACQTNAKLSVHCAIESPSPPPNPSPPEPPPNPPSLSPSISPPLKSSRKSTESTFT
ncbi:uncharacterized protein [Physcomitrium patens]|uniref:Uncharacterized protein n=1 Tax=Physcomitrium patens TaxID=3218 RepID=A0A2K1JPW7_PHYPA|nr:transmembrane glycoprotein NMB-like [Physcomitrium patens]PNR43577.1 hypothetical protein PHYPA_015958 [Physcomitrium patens]|eukprot:XP_024390577.1 transmembrane glycoprotein NMB-like [Physcomitrella patens]